MKMICTTLRNRKGATAIEYGLIAALIAVAAITAMSGLGTQLNTTFTNITNKLANPTG
ncbi:Flp family type IVb pilin [Sphingomonas sp. CFBP8993]|uniref:Flp family type IVb pilin n=1 Tax=Sphingomonas sp. CFBP8993 TaxID=3096526 RepID=UPI002A6A8D75|nr:Flp family type IVb pilin [Sphingomonas sp. CFBP8993]MDY0957508.1 Flp family type IVb pilin [Sphingomonas sp. CFBP8993]